MFSLAVWIRRCIHNYNIKKNIIVLGAEEGTIIIIGDQHSKHSAPSFKGVRRDAPPESFYILAVARVLEMRKMRNR